MTLNPELAGFLRRRFGQDNVRILRENVPMRCHYSNKQMGGKLTVKLNIEPQGRGEEFLVNCPFCSDTRGRLSINYRWGVYDYENQSHNLWLATCYNEDCLKDRGTQKELHDQVYSFAMVDTTSLTSPEKAVIEGVRQTRNIRLPSGLWPLQDMCSRSPRHPAIAYLLDRLIEPYYVGKVYNAMYCVDSSDIRIGGRLVVPIVKDDVLVSWQARLLRPPINKKEPKWYTAPGSDVSRTLYNCDVALKHHTVVVVEGITDVWGFGCQSCGVFKKSLSDTQVELLVERTRSDATIVIMFDPDQDPKEKEKGKEHHIEVAQQLLAKTPLEGRVLPVYLPTGTDPGELDRAYMRDLIREEGKRAKLTVNFGE